MPPLKRYKLVKHALNEPPEEIGSVLHLGYLDFISSCYIPDCGQPFYTLVPDGGGQVLLITKSDQMHEGLDVAPFLFQLEYDNYNPNA